MKAATQLRAGLIFLLLFFVQGILFIRANSPTYDEAMHLAAGYSYLAKRDFRLEPQNPPFVKELLALPVFLYYRFPFNPDIQLWRNGDGYLIGQELLYKSTLPAERMLFLSRFPNLFLGGALLALTGWWAYRLWGGWAAMLAMALASVEPNLIAHSSLVTTDTGAALFIFFTIYLLWEYLNFPSWALLAASGITMGMSLVSKFSAIILIPMIILLLGFSLFLGSQSRFIPDTKRDRTPTQKFLEVFILFFFIVLFGSFMIPLAYLFQGIQPWLAGLRRFFVLAEQGQLAFFLGDYSYQGWWNYFLVAFLIKTPIGTLVLVFASLVFCRAGTPLGRRETIFLLSPVIFLFITLTQAKVNIGLRHMLPIYPFLFILASRVTTIRFRSACLVHLLITFPVLLTAISSLRLVPHQLAYFNEFVGGPGQGYRYLSDSNIDWGQELKGVKAYMDQENLPIIYLSYFGTAPPSYYGIRYQYVPGSWPLEWPPPSDRVPATARKILAISVRNLQDASIPHIPLFGWLRQRQPIAKIGYSIFVYDLTDDQEGLTKLQESYVKAGVTL